VDWIEADPTWKKISTMADDGLRTVKMKTRAMKAIYESSNSATADKDKFRALLADPLSPGNISWLGRDPCITLKKMTDSSNWTRLCCDTY
jgi:hypothetical protein